MDTYIADGPIDDSYSYLVYIVTARIPDRWPALYSVA